MCMTLFAFCNQHQLKNIKIEKIIYVITATYSQNLNSLDASIEARSKH